MSFAEDFHTIFDPIVQEFEESLELPGLPFEVAPFQYAGMGFFVPEKPHEAPLLPFVASLPTMTLERKRDVMTGEVVGYEDVPICRDSEEDAPMRAKDQPQIDLDKMVSALDTGDGLMSLPWRRKLDEPLPGLPNEDGTGTPAVQMPPPPEDKKKYKAIVDDWDVSRFEEEVPHPARVFPYELDAWQKRAIRRLERGECVFVSAPTSAGKTVVAEYAFALCCEHNTRALYAAQTRALSNQKYRDFLNTGSYDSVGILTGDGDYNHDASVVVVTNESLRETLYHEVDTLRDVEYIVFDEWFYSSDSARMHVWEECIMAIPERINLVFLSATVPNDTEVATWIARTRERMVYIERHVERPVPVEHYLCVENELLSISSGDCLFNDANYTAAKDKFKGRVSDLEQTTVPNRNQTQRLVKLLNKKKMLPALFFFFSQERVWNIGKLLSQSRRNLYLIDDSKKQKITKFIKAALARLSPEDRELDEVRTVVSLMEQGMGVHHAGMLPIMKQCVEILFARGCLKALFCTETFAVGVNTPARTCVFAAMKKYDDRVMNRPRYLTPKEYIQMGGRAGRRGCDTTGNVVIWCTHEVPHSDYLRKFVTGNAEKLESQFFLRANTVLYQVRANAGRMSDFLKRSLWASQREKEIHRCQRQLHSPNQSPELPTTNCSLDFGKLVSDLKEAFSEVRYLQEAMRNVIVKGSIIFVAPINTGIVTIGVVTGKPKEDLFEVFTLAEKKVRNVSLTYVIGVFQDKIPEAKTNNATEVQKELVEILNKGSKPKPLKHLLKRSSAELANHSDNLDRLCGRILEEEEYSPCIRCAKWANDIREACNRDCEKQRYDQLVAQRDQGQVEFDCYVNYLTELGYIRDHAITLKGEVSLVLESTSGAILASELLFRDVFTELPPEDICAVCAALCATPVRRREGGSVPGHLNATIHGIEDVACEVCDRMIDKGLKIRREQWLKEHYCVGVVGPVHLWAQGKSWAKVAPSARDIPVGALMAVIMGTSQLLGCYSRAAMMIGNTELSQRFEDARGCIEHGMVVCPSLYVDPPPE